MPEQPVKGEEALKRMAQLGLGRKGNLQKDSEEYKDPLEEAQKFTKQMAANAIIEGEVAKSKAAVAKAEAEADEARARAEKARSGESGTKSSPVVKGSIDLGNINYQEMLLQQQNDLKQLKREAEEQASKQAAVSDDLREKLHAKEMEVLKTSFDAQMQALTQMIQANVSKGSFIEQYNSTIETAKALGLGQTQGIGDLAGQIELKKMEFEHARELRKMAREEKRADREFQRQLNRDADERDARKAELTLQREEEKRKRDWWDSLPEAIGAAGARASLANRGKSRKTTEESPPEPEAQRGKQRHRVDADWDESGEAECPSCGEPIAIGPTAQMAVCANCGERLSIKRKGERLNA